MCKVLRNFIGMCPWEGFIRTVIPDTTINKRFGKLSCCFKLTLEIWKEKTSYSIAWTYLQKFLFNGASILRILATLY